MILIFSLKRHREHLKIKVEKVVYLFNIFYEKENLSVNY
jgi:hypothetical protein